jgi:hypothetical protein
VTDRNGNLRQVTYQDVVGVGVVTGLAYTVTYTESHPTETRFTARLTMQSSESFFTELTTMSYQGIPITIDRCR